MISYTNSPAPLLSPFPQVLLQRHRQHMRAFVARAETRCHTRLAQRLALSNANANANANASTNSARLEREAAAADCAPDRQTDASFASPLPSSSARHPGLAAANNSKSAKRPSYSSALGGSLLEEELTDALRDIQASARKQRQERESRGPMGFGLLPAVSSLLASSTTPLKDKSGAHSTPM